MTKIHYYKGYAINKPEGCILWNVHEIIENKIDWCFSLAHAKNIKEAKITIDYIRKEIK